MAVAVICSNDNSRMRVLLDVEEALYTYAEVECNSCMFTSLQYTRYVGTIDSLIEDYWRVTDLRAIAGLYIFFRC